jgi:hypothetical protein
MHGLAELLEIQRGRLPFRLNLRRFDGEGGDGGGSGAGDAGSGGTGAAGEGEGGEGGSGAGDAGKPAGDGAPKTFTQEQIDKIVKDRLERQRQQFAGFDDLKKKAEDWDKLQEEQKSELEKASDRATKAEEERDRALQTGNERLLRGEVKAAAAKAGFIDPDDAFALLDRTDVKIDDDGNVAGIDEALKALAEAKPHLVTDTRAGGSADGGARGGANGKKDFRTASNDEYAAELAKHGLRPRST